MEFFAQFIREIFMQFPGALIRWVWFRREKTFNEVLTDDSAYNVILSFVVIGVIIASIILLKN